jgi:PIN domain nuclease of toxin-antitoxin system
VKRSGAIWRPTDLTDYEGALLLDTHVWVWYLDGNTERIAQSLLQVLERSGRSNQLLVSDISYWEAAVKARKGKLVFSIEPAIWLRRAEATPGIRGLPLDRETLLLSTRLSGSEHNDPVDRMLIAAAQLNNLPLVTSDRLIIDYAAAHPGTPVVDART